MESVTIAAPFEYELELNARLQEIGPAKAVAGGLVIEDGNSRVYVCRNDAVRDELEPEQLDRILSTIPRPVFYTVDFSDLALCRRVLEAIADDPGLLVDNDHGVLLDGATFIGLLRARPAWDWRGTHEE